MYASAIVRRGYESVWTADSRLQCTLDLEKTCYIALLFVGGTGLALQLPTCYTQLPKN